jgi:hypothetical protein
MGSTFWSYEVALFTLTMGLLYLTISVVLPNA